jgi:hypothetical protein
MFIVIHGNPFLGHAASQLLSLDKIFQNNKALYYIHFIRNLGLE